MHAVATERLYTPEDLLTMPDGDRYELIDGRLVEHDMSFWSCFVASNINRLVANHCHEHKSGWPVGEGATYQCFPDAPNMVRKADVSFIRLSRLSLAQATSKGHCPIAPDLATEVVSPNDGAYEVDEKVQLWLSAGVELVWVVNPQQQTVEIHRRNGPGTILRGADVITGENVLPGFSCPIAAFFAPPPGSEGTNGVAAQTPNA